jgi:hypothetical protein
VPVGIYEVGTNLSCGFTKGLPPPNRRLALSRQGRQPVPDEHYLSLSAVCRCGLSRVWSALPLGPARGATAPQDIGYQAGGCRAHGRAVPMDALQTAAHWLLSAAVDGPREFQPKSDLETGDPRPAPQAVEGV